MQSILYKIIKKEILNRENIFFLINQKNIFNQLLEGKSLFTPNIAEEWE
jgi:hypothetical protein